jgi:hypothetical protein
MMLRSKYILLIILWFVGAQFVASQTVVLDSVKSDSVALQYVDSLATDTIELADAEFEAWLEEYAEVREVREDGDLQMANDSLQGEDNEVRAIDGGRDVVERRDFVGLVNEGEEARKREKNALISSVMASLNNKMQSEELVVKEDSISVLAGDMADTLVGYDFVELLNRVAVDSILATAIDAD